MIKEGNIGVIQDSVAVGEHMFAMISTHTPMPSSRIPQQPSVGQGGVQVS